MSHFGQGRCGSPAAISSRNIRLQPLQHFTRVYSALPPLVAPTTGIGPHGAANSAGSHSFPFNMVFRPCQRRPRSLLRFASIEGLERVKDSPGLAPKSRFIAAEPIKSEVRKVGETQKAMGEVDIRSVGVFSRVGYRFHLTYNTV